MRTHIILHTVAKKGTTPWAEIKRWHVEENGWKDVGYHYYVRKDGVIEAGRMENVNGAHCPLNGMNRVSIAICFEGHGDKEPWTDIQSEKGLDLIRNLCWRYKIPASNVQGHNEHDKGKTCPGKLIDMESVRGKIQTLLHGTI